MLLRLQSFSQLFNWMQSFHPESTWITLVSVYDKKPVRESTRINMNHIGQCPWQKTCTWINQNQHESTFKKPMRSWNLRTGVRLWSSHALLSRKVTAARSIVYSRMCAIKIVRQWYYPAVVKVINLASQFCLNLAKWSWNWFAVLVASIRFDKIWHSWWSSVSFRPYAPKASETGFGRLCLFGSTWNDFFFRCLTLNQSLRLNMEMALMKAEQRERHLLWTRGCTGCWRQMLVQRTFPRHHFDFVIFWLLNKSLLRRSLLIFQVHDSHLRHTLTRHAARCQCCRVLT